MANIHKTDIIFTFALVYILIQIELDVKQTKLVNENVARFDKLSYEIPSWIKVDVLEQEVLKNGPDATNVWVKHHLYVTIAHFLTIG